MNSLEIEQKIGAGGGLAARLARPLRPVVERVEELFLSTLSRLPTAREIDNARSYLAARVDAKGSRTSRRRAWEDLLWALLNSNEFLFVR